MNPSTKTAIVTGGARAIGKCISLTLARQGYNVVLAAPEKQDLEQTAYEIEQMGRRACAVLTDVSHENDVQNMVRRALDTFGTIDLLVNNAGIIGPTCPVIETSRADWDEVLAVNLTGTFLCCKAVLPAMIRHRSGKIVNISSIAGKIAYPLRSPYAVSKWGVIGFTMTLAKEVGQYGIQVNAICPGPVSGERMKRIIETRAAELQQTPEQVERTYLETTLLKRFIMPEDIANMVAYLAAPTGDAITGQTIDITAGYAI
ncbi:MAG: beta-ketoacyl-ACP reductase [Gemmatales bacterium]|nr:MAG: beta-ketoacyl-ACP reductase [Gemmatales bacterium]